jgi:hypothetical protein
MTCLYWNFFMWVVFLSISLCFAFTVVPVPSQIIQASNRANVNPGWGGAGFGNNMEISADGKVIVVAAPFEPSCSTVLPGDEGCFQAGAGYVFLQDGAGVWQQVAYLKAARPYNVSGTGAGLGVALAISRDGSVIVMGGSKNGANSTGVFNGGPSSPNVLAAESALSFQQTGAVWVFRRTPGTNSWVEEAFITRDASVSLANDFGASISLSADASVLAVCSGQFGFVAAGPNRTVHMYRYISMNWVLEQIISHDTTLVPGFG